MLQSPRWFAWLLILYVSLPIARCMATHSIHSSDLTTLDLQGHRGARGLRPENTWPSFRTAIDFQMTTLELDTVLTKDGAVIIHHDIETNPEICRNLDGTPIQKKSIYELTLSELKMLDCGSLKNSKFPEQVPVPGTPLLTIEEFFRLVAQEEGNRKKKGLPPLRFNIETKFPDPEKINESTVNALVKTLVSAIERAKTVEVSTIQSFYLPVLPLVKSLNPRIQTSALFAPTRPQGLWMILGGGSGYRRGILDQASRFQADIISPYYLYVNSEFMHLARERRLRVIPWTVNDKQEMRRLISLGVDGIITDYPDRLLDVVHDLKKSQ